jgi:hypothetical protein
MANPKIADAGKATQFQPGNRANPGGKPVAARNRLQGDFLRALADDFEENGASAIRRTREEQPAAYLKVVASLMPKELEIKRPLEDLSDDDLIAGVAALQSYLNAGGSQNGAGSEASGEQAAGVPSVH